jgi:putative spermidine/putrescine transport system ATP-binding protein
VQGKSKPLSVRGLTHSYGGVAAVENVSFEIAPGEIAALLGPSGCGKTTVLRAVAGLLPVRPGVISLAGVDLSPLPGRARDIGMVFQNYALFPHLTVAENIGYALSCRGWPRERKRARVAELIATVKLEGMERRLPRSLSGGQQQRVAVARALAGQPSILLADEPTGNLDSRNGDAVMELLRDLHQAGSTICMVTHDARFARHADRTVHLFDGRILDEGAEGAPSAGAA